MLVGADDGGIDDQIFEVGIIGQTGEHPLPSAFCTPSAETAESAVPIAEFRGQIAPRRARANDPEHRFNKHPVVAARGAALAVRSDDRLTNTRPMIVAQHKPVVNTHDCLDVKATLHHCSQKF